MKITLWGFVKYANSFKDLAKSDLIVFIRCGNYPAATSESKLKCSQR